MPQYTRVIKRDRFNVCVSLLDGTTQLVPISDFHTWDMVIALTDTSLLNTEEHKEKKVIEENKEDSIIEVKENQDNEIDLFNEVETDLQDAEEIKEENKTEEVKVEDIQEYVKVPKKRGRKKVDKEEKPKEPKSKKTWKADYKAGSFRKNTNGLGVDHPYEMVNMFVESIYYSDGVEAPF